MSRPALFSGHFIKTFMSRISSIVFDKHEQPKRATLVTKLGPVKVEWMDVCGDRCWFTAGILDAKKLALPAIQRIELMARRA